MSGLIFTLGYVLIGSLRDVYFSHILKQINIFVVITATFSITMIFFWAIQASKLQQFLKNLKENRFDILLINLTTAIMWFSFIYALKVVEPAIVNSFVCS